MFNQYGPQERKEYATFQQFKRAVVKEARNRGWDTRYIDNGTVRDVFNNGCGTDEDVQFALNMLFGWQ